MTATGGEAIPDPCEFGARGGERLGSDGRGARRVADGHRLGDAALGQGARPDFENLRNTMLSLGCLFPLLGYRRSWGWLLGITPILSNSVASCCESLQTSTTSAKDRSEHSTENAANPTAIVRAQARRDMARTGC